MARRQGQGEPTAGWSRGGSLSNREEIPGRAGDKGDPLSAGWLAPPPRAQWLAGWALVPLRAFLGFTFTFAGLQKLANPGFFTASDPASIQAQLAGAARRSPIHALVSPLVHVAVPLGVVIALGELAVGLGTLAGVRTRVAATGGALLSFMLFLTVSFHSNPYYTGSDIVFVFAWTALIVAGDGGVLSLDSVLSNRARTKVGAEPQAVVAVPFSVIRRTCGAYENGFCRARRGAPCEPAPCPYLEQRLASPRALGVREMDRRTFTAKATGAAAVAGIGLVAAGAVAAIGRLVGGASNAGGTPTLGLGASSAKTPTTEPPGGATSTTSPGGAQPAGTRIGPARDVPVGGAASFQDPNTGDPSLVVQPEAGSFLAFDAVCPHAGCTVQYNSSDKLFMCPCHGSEFNGTTGAVEVGPATRGLTKIDISESSGGELYVT